VFQVNKTWAGAYPGITWQEGKWYCLEVRAPQPASTATVKCWLDGTEFASFNTDLSDVVSWNQMQCGLMDATVALTPTVYIDELAVADFYIGPVSNVAPVISDIAAAVSGTLATITFNTDVTAISALDYGVSTGYGDTVTEGYYALNHSMTIPGLTTGQAYHYRVRCTNIDGLETVSPFKTFTVTGTEPLPQVSPEVHAYPNPCKVSASNPMKFRAAGAASSEVNIYTVTGRLVRKLSGGEEISWDGRNQDGEKLARGIYIYKIRGSNGDSVTGKLALTK